MMVVKEEAVDERMSLIYHAVLIASAYLYGPHL